jgi:hypothetical protein
LVVQPTASCYTDYAIPAPHVQPVASRYTDCAIPAPHVQPVASRYTDCAILALHVQPVASHYTDYAIPALSIKDVPTEKCMNLKKSVSSLCKLDGRRSCYTHNTILDTSTVSSSHSWVFVIPQPEAWHNTQTTVTLLAVADCSF